MANILKLNVDNTTYALGSMVKTLNIDGIEYSMGIDTSDATAEASDILFGKTAYARGEKLDGIFIPSNIVTFIGVHSVATTSGWHSTGALRINDAYLSSSYIEVPDDSHVKFLVPGNYSLVLFNSVLMAGGLRLKRSTGETLVEDKFRKSNGPLKMELGSFDVTQDEILTANYYKYADQNMVIFAAFIFNG